MVDQLDKDMRELVAKGKSQGYLTYDEVTRVLPDDEVDPDKLDNLLFLLDEKGIELVTEPPEGEFYDPSESGPKERETQAPKMGDGEVPVDTDARPVDPADVPKWSNDPIRLYLGQMAEIPLLAREEEISLAKKIEMTRKRFRRSVLGCHLGMRNAFSTLAKVHRGVLPFDRTIKVSLTERLTKDQIQARMPYNLRTLDHLLEASRRDFGLLIRRGTDHEARAAARKQFLRRRRKILVLLEELSLRTRRVQAMMRQMEDVCSRMEEIRERLRLLISTPATRARSACTPHSNPLAVTSADRRLTRATTRGGRVGSRATAFAQSM
jgi:RNA polymerase primary sigma factor